MELAVGQREQVARGVIGVAEHFAVGVRLERLAGGSVVSEEVAEPYLVRVSDEAARRIAEMLYAGVRVGAGEETAQVVVSHGDAHAVGVPTVGDAVFGIEGEGGAEAGKVLNGVELALVVEPVGDDDAGAVGGVGKFAQEVVVEVVGVEVGIGGLGEPASVIVGEIGVVASGVLDGVEGAAGAIVVAGGPAQRVGLGRAAADGVIGEGVGKAHAVFDLNHVQFAVEVGNSAQWVGAVGEAVKGIVGIGGAQPALVGVGVHEVVGVCEGIGAVDFQVNGRLHEVRVGPSGEVKIGGGKSGGGFDTGEAAVRVPGVGGHVAHSVGGV